MRKEDKNGEGPLASVDQLMGAPSSKPKGCGLDSWSGDMPRLQVWSPVSKDVYKSQRTDVALSQKHHIPVGCGDMTCCGQPSDLHSPPHFETVVYSQHSRSVAVPIFLFLSLPFPPTLQEKKKKNEELGREEGRNGDFRGQWRGT